MLKPMENETICHLTASEIYSSAFESPRELRSDEYKAGVLAALKTNIEGIRLECPYPAGTAQCDAYCAGKKEGQRLYHDIARHSRKIKLE